MAEKNALDANSLLQTAEGGLNETHAILHRIRELAIQAANDTYTDQERQAMQAEVNELLDEVNAITGRTAFNTQNLLDGSFTDKKFQIGANSGQQMSVSIGSMDVEALGLGHLFAEIDSKDGMLTQEGANDAIDALDQAINKVSMQRSNIGAQQNRLEHTIKYLGVTRENLTAAESRIRDVDIAKEMMNFAKYQILTQVSQIVLAQANQLQQGVLQLLR